jgi:hypothetical protein
VPCPAHTKSSLAVLQRWTKKRGQAMLPKDNKPVLAEGKTVKCSDWLGISSFFLYLFFLRYIG